MTGELSHETESKVKSETLGFGKAKNNKPLKPRNPPQKKRPPTLSRCYGCRLLLPKAPSAVGHSCAALPRLPLPPFRRSAQNPRFCSSYSPAPIARPGRRRGGDGSHRRQQVQARPQDRQRLLRGDLPRFDLEPAWLACLISAPPMSLCFRLLFGPD
jgi:hypothetical protein